MGMEKKQQEAAENEGHEISASALETWLRSARSSSTPEELHLSIIIPAYNEERRLPPTLIEIIDFFDASPTTYEILVVDDGSTDATSEMAKKFEKIRPQVRILQLPRNYGKGHAVRTGALNAKGELVLFADADGSTPIQEVNRLIEAISDGADIAIGSRALQSDETEVKTRIHRKVIGRIFNFFVNVFLLPGMADTQCGFKLFTRPVASFLFRKQQSDGFSFDLELLLLSRKAGLTLAEVPVNWENVPGSKVNLITDSLKMFIDIFRFAWRHRSVTPEEYAQHAEEITGSGKR
jgi:dolichyl-phosphate beta-glucosyltransferase